MRTHTMNLLQYIKNVDQEKKDNQNHEDPQQETIGMQGELAREDVIIYADDTNTLSGHDTMAHLATRLRNYAQIATGRQVGIQWKVEIITKRKTRRGLKKELRPPFRNIKLQERGKR